MFENINYHKWLIHGSSFTQTLIEHLLLRSLSCLYWRCLVKETPSFCPFNYNFQGSCHSMEEAEILSTSGRTRKKLDKSDWREHITLVSLLSRILADWGGWVIFFFLLVRTLHSFWHLIDWKKNPADVTSEVKIIIVITAVAPNFSIEQVTWQKLSINTYIPPIWQEKAYQTYFTGESPRLIEFGLMLKYIRLVNDNWQ